jgi:hypothetical protein
MLGTGEKGSQELFFSFMSFFVDSVFASFANGNNQDVQFITNNFIY